MAKTKQKRRQVLSRQAKKMARRKARKAHSNATGGLAAGKVWGFPLHECKVTENYRETGRAFVVVNRISPRGGLTGGVFYVDLWGIGIKDCFLTADVPATVVLVAGHCPVSFHS